MMTTQHRDQKANRLFITALITLGMLMLMPIFAQTQPVQIGDTRLYGYYGQKMWVDHQIPYRDFPVEYPPGVLVPMGLAYPLAASISGGRQPDTLIYSAAFMMIAGLAFACVLYDRHKQSGTRGALEFSLMMMPIGIFLFVTLDIFAAAALYFAIQAVRRQQAGRAGILLGLATLVKGYPLICFLLFLAGLARTKWKRFVGALAATLFIGLLPLLANPSAARYTLGYHLNRPLEVESGAAGFGYLAHLFGNPVRLFASHASHAASFPGSGFTAALFSVLLLIGLLYQSIRFIQMPKVQQKSRLALACLSITALFLAFFKVGSPQFIVALVVLGVLAAEELIAHDALLLKVRIVVLGIVTLIITSQFLDSDILAKGPGVTGVLVFVRFILLFELAVWTYRQLRAAPLHD